MEQYKLGEMETRLAQLIWEHQPLSTRALTERCQEEFDWKRTTTYTMLKRLCDRKLFENRDGVVVALMPQEDFQAAQGELFVEETFGGSLPLFMAAFTRHRKLSKTDVEELRRLIDEYEEE